MKIRNYILLVIVTLSIFSCTKDEDFFGTPYYYVDTLYVDRDTISEEEEWNSNSHGVDYINDDIANSGDEIEEGDEEDILPKILDKDWVLTNAIVYVENRDLNIKKYYDYFNNEVKSASMSLFDITEVPKFDEITLHETTWNFTDGDNFIIDDEYTYYMQTHYNPFGDLIFRPYGFYGGTARPIVVQYATNDMIKVITRESFNSDNTYNYKYFSELTFKKKGTNYGYDNQIIEDYSYGGVWQYNYAVTSNTTLIGLGGTKWVISRYDRGMEPYYPNDTLTFLSNNTYTINNDVTERRYSIYNVTNSNMSSITLYGLTTLGGDYSGEVLTQGLIDGELNNNTFNSIWNNDVEVNVWFRKIN